MIEQPNKRYNDFLEVILDLPSYQDDEKLIVDECINFFIAGTNTVTAATTNLIHYLIQNPTYLKKLRDEII